MAGVSHWFLCQGTFWAVGEWLLWQSVEHLYHGLELLSEKRENKIMTNMFLKDFTHIYNIMASFFSNSNSYTFDTWSINNQGTKQKCHVILLFILLAWTNREYGTGLWLHLILDKAEERRLISSILSWSQSCYTLNYNYICT